jgi:predicted nucleic acid-binding protein
MILFLDRNIVIYAIENPLVLGPKANARLTAARNTGDVFMISDLVRMEALVGPLKSGNSALQQDYAQFFTSNDMTAVSITTAVCDRAARVRATHNFKSMDALQLAAAVEYGASIFLTADARLSAFTGLTVEVLR